MRSCVSCDLDGGRGRGDGAPRPGPGSPGWTRRIAGPGPHRPSQPWPQEFTPARASDLLDSGAPVYIYIAPL